MVLFRDTCQPQPRPNTQLLNHTKNAATAYCYTNATSTLSLNFIKQSVIQSMYWSTFKVTKCFCNHHIQQQHIKRHICFILQYLFTCQCFHIEKAASLYCPISSGKQGYTFFVCFLHSTAGDIKHQIQVRRSSYIASMATNECSLCVKKLVRDVNCYMSTSLHINAFSYLGAVICCCFLSESCQH